MLKQIATLLLVTSSCLLCRAGGTNIFSVMSPDLRQFLATHPGASESLSNTLSEAFAGRSIQLYYFYSDDQNVARAFHYYPDASSVGIVIQENQQPSDQSICLIFEMLNSEGEKQFQALSEQAQAGTISKTNFVIGILRQEFEAVQRMKALLPHFKLSKLEMAKSHYYMLYLDCPNTFDGFLSYSKHLWSSGKYVSDRIVYYEQQYDSLQAAIHRPNTALEPTAIAPLVSTNK